MDKPALRRKLQAEQAHFDDDYVANVSRAILTEIRHIIMTEQPRDVLLYTPVKNWHEVDVSSLLVDTPSVKFDILDNARDMSFPTKPYDCIIVPLLGFTKDGFRLGRGGGWYDQFLVTQPHALKIGVGYEDTLVRFVPEVYDIPLNIIVTEQTVRDFRTYSSKIDKKR